MVGFSKTQCEKIESSLVKFLNHYGQTFKNLKYSVTKFVSVCYKKLRQCDQICIPVKAVWLNSCQFVMQIRKCDQICKQCDWIHISLLGKSGHTAFFRWVCGVGWVVVWNMMWFLDRPLAYKKTCLLIF